MKENKPAKTGALTAESPGSTSQDCQSTASGNDRKNSSIPDAQKKTQNVLENFQKLCFYKRNADGEFIFVNSKITNLLGYSPEEYMANWESYLADDFREDPNAICFMQGFQQQESPSYDLKFIHQDGRHVWLEMIESPLLDSKGKILAIEGIVHDITRRKVREEGLRFSEMRFREMSESSPVGIFQINPDDNYLYVNIHWQIITGQTLNKTLGTTWWKIIHPEDQEKIFQGWTKAEQEEREFFSECRILRADNEFRWIELKTKFLFHNRGKLTFGTMEDITERKESEEKLERFAEELQRSNQALDDFAAIASHDLQEPLRKIIAFSTRIKDLYAASLDERGTDYLERMQKATLRMQTFIHDLLEFSRVTTKAKPFEPTNLKDLVVDVLHDLEARIAQTKGSVEIMDLPLLDADPFQMRQLFQNLIGNALKFHRPGVSPVVKVSASKKPKKNAWRIEIADNGIGFDIKYLERIFKPFERLQGRSQYEGSGIGLAICAKIAVRHGGVLTAKSTPEEGSSFILTLPEKQQG